MEMPRVDMKWYTWLKQRKWQPGENSWFKNLAEKKNSRIDIALEDILWQWKCQVSRKYFRKSTHKTSKSLIYLLYVRKCDITTFRDNAYFLNIGTYTISLLPSWFYKTQHYHWKILYQKHKIGQITLSKLNNGIVVWEYSYISNALNKSNMLANEEQLVEQVQASDWYKRWHLMLWFRRIDFWLGDRTFY